MLRQIKSGVSSVSEVGQGPRERKGVLTLECPKARVFR